MTGEVISFKIDHEKLMPGIYVHDTKEIKGHSVTTYDFRFKRPNHGDYLTPCQAHTIEHVMATFFTENMPEKIYFGPMGCFTGFYLVVDGVHDLDFVLSRLSELDEYWRELLADNWVPAKTPVRCGNYKLLDIKEGFTAWNAFYMKRDKWGSEYTLIDENACQMPDEFYQTVIDHNVKCE